MIANLLMTAIKKKGRYSYIFPTLKGARTAWEKLDTSPLGAVKLNHSEMKILLTNGSVIGFVSAENPDMLLGLNVKGVVFDEIGDDTDPLLHHITPFLTENENDS